MKLIHTELVHKCSAVEFDTLDLNIREDVRHRVHNQYVIQLKKLQKLNNSKSSLITNRSCVSFQSRIKNLTYVKFNQREINLLEKGLKYCPNLECKKDLELLAVNTELALNKPDNHVQKDIEKVTFAGFINKYNNNKNKSSHKNSEYMTIKNFNRKLKEQDLILCKSYKGNTVTILSRKEYF